MTAYTQTPTDTVAVTESIVLRVYKPTVLFGQLVKDPSVDTSIKTIELQVLYTPTG